MSNKQTITLTPKELEYMLKVLAHEENIDRLTIVAEDGSIGVRTDIYFKGIKSMSTKQSITLTPKELEYMLKVLSNEENIDRLTIVAEEGSIGIKTDIYFNGKKYDITDYDQW